MPLQVMIVEDDDRIREVRRMSNIPIVIVSARSDTVDIVAGFDPGRPQIVVTVRAMGYRLDPR